MNEKFARLICVLLACVTLVPGGVATAIEPAQDEAPPTTITTAEPIETRPPITANDFIPEEENLTDCLGTLERPGCGSEERGGWRQTLVFVAMGVGLLVVFGNIVRTARKNRPSPD